MILSLFLHKSTTKAIVTPLSLSNQIKQELRFEAKKCETLKIPSPLFHSLFFLLYDTEMYTGRNGVRNPVGNCGMHAYTIQCRREWENTIISIMHTDEAGS